MVERFRTPNGTVPAVTAAEMRAVDRVAVEETGPRLPSMMENAGRNLARAVGRVADLDPDRGPPTAVVLAGAGGNGGGGLAAARHLANHCHDVRVVPGRDPGGFEGATATQWATLDAMGVDPVAVADVGGLLDGAGVVVDALVGYSLDGALQGTAADLAIAANGADAPVVSLDVPSGVDATTGDRPGPAVTPDCTVTLALPKTGLSGADGRLLLADIGLPAVVFERAGIAYDRPFDGEYLLDVEPAPG